MKNLSLRQQLQKPDEERFLDICTNAVEAKQRGDFLIAIMTKQVETQTHATELYRRYRRDCQLLGIEPVDPPEGHLAERRRYPKYHPWEQRTYLVEEKSKETRLT